MPFNHLNLCHPLLLLPSIFPSIHLVAQAKYLGDAHSSPLLMCDPSMSLFSSSQLAWSRVQFLPTALHSINVPVSLGCPFGLGTLWGGKSRVLHTKCDQEGIWVGSEHSQPLQPMHSSPCGHGHRRPVRTIVWGRAGLPLILSSGFLLTKKTHFGHACYHPSQVTHNGSITPHWTTASRITSWLSVLPPAPRMPFQKYKSGHSPPSLKLPLTLRMKSRLLALIGSPGVARRKGMYFLWLSIGFAS